MPVASALCPPDERTKKAEAVEANLAEAAKRVKDDESRPDLDHERNLDRSVAPPNRKPRASVVPPSRVQEPDEAEAMGCDREVSLS